mgnify:FL=1
MTRYVCINCVMFIRKSAISDPYMCRDCEKLIGDIEEKQRYAYLDNY